MYLVDLEDALGRFGSRLAQIYGQGETPMTITALSKADHADRDHPRWRDRLQSVGVARTDVEVRVVDDDGRALAAERDRRSGGPRRRGDGRLLEPTRGHRRDAARRLAAHRRRRQLRRGRLPHAARPLQGPDHQRGHEHLPPRGRRGAAAPRRRPVGGRGRKARPRVGRDGGGLRRARRRWRPTGDKTSSTARAWTASPATSGRRTTASSMPCRPTAPARCSNGSCTNSSGAMTRKTATRADNFRSVRHAVRRPPNEARSLPPELP